MKKEVKTKGYRVNPNEEIRIVYLRIKNSLENMGLETYTFGQFIDDMFERRKSDLDTFIIEKRVPDEFKIKAALQDPKTKSAILSLIGKKRIPTKSVASEPNKNI